MARRRPARRYTAYRKPVKRRATRRTKSTPASRWFAALAMSIIVTVIVPAFGVILLFGLLGVSGFVIRAHRRTARGGRIGGYQTMTPKQFEYALADLCRRDGCTRVTVVGGAGDLGADVLATTPDGRRMVIQAKRYAPTNKVGSPEVQKVGGTYSVVHRAQLAAVVTTSGYTKAAVDYAARAGIRLYGQRELAGWASRTGPAPWH